MMKNLLAIFTLEKVRINILDAVRNVVQKEEENIMTTLALPLEESPSTAGAT